MTRYFYAYGYATQNAAYEAMLNLMNEGEISYAESPEIKSYTTKDGRIRYGVTLRSN